MLRNVDENSKKDISLFVDLGSEPFTLEQIKELLQIANLEYPCNLHLEKNDDDGVITKVVNDLTELILHLNDIHLCYCVTVECNYYFRISFDIFDSISTKSSICLTRFDHNLIEYLILQPNVLLIEERNTNDSFDKIFSYRSYIYLFLGISNIPSINGEFCISPCYKMWFSPKIFTYFKKERFLSFKGAIEIKEYDKGFVYIQLFEDYHDISYYKDLTSNSSVHKWIQKGGLIGKILSFCCMILSGVGIWDYSEKVIRGGNYKIQKKFISHIKYLGTFFKYNYIQMKNK